MMLSLCISTKTANVDGSMQFYAESISEPEILQARLSRYKTLDGNAKIIHAGFSEGDRTLKIKAKITETRWEQLKTIFKTELLICLATMDGFFSAAIENIRLSGGNAEMTILIESEI